MLPEKIHLVDRSPPLVAAWAEAFEAFPFVESHVADFFSFQADAMVSPAIMDGGLDLAIRDTLGFPIQQAAQRVILERHHGELPVGLAEVVETGDGRWPFLIIAPTMRIPESVAQTVNAYLAFRATLLAVQAHNAAGRPLIRSLLCPGLATGIGCMEPRRCAAQMRIALTHVQAPARIPSYHQNHAVHRALRTA